ncbi:MAG: SDR family oxidoreductase [Elusimicrobia bacterium]|nr:SDR family oxidoreductase [Elusimicrobiota bacterium]
MRNLPNLLLTGATGFLGRHLDEALSPAWRVSRASRSAAGPGALALDLAQPASIERAFAAARPAAVVHSGAIAGPDDCERDPERARRVNAEATRVLAGLCAKAGARLVFVSTDLVFDGARGLYAEGDAPRPLSVYGRVKREAEEAVLALTPGAFVLRVSSVYGRPLGGRPCFVERVRRALAGGREFAAFVDEVRSPTDADQLAGVVGRLLDGAAPAGLYHWSGGERSTRFETARAAARAFGLDERLVRPARAGDSPAPRPRDSSLDPSCLAGLLGLAPRTQAEGFAALAARA